MSWLSRWLESPWPLTVGQSVLIGAGLGLGLVCSVHRVFFGHWRVWDFTMRRRP